MKLLTLARDLKRRKAREKHSLFVAEGVRAVEELVRAGLSLRGAIVAPQLLEAPRGSALRSAMTASAIDVLEVSEKDFRSAAETESPQGVLAIGEIPAFSFESLIMNDYARILLLDAVQDPGNVGTIVRTAAALGATATVALPGTVDLWNPKVIRSSMGAQFKHPSFHATTDEALTFLRDASVELWGAEAEGDNLESRDAPARLAVVVGNEGAGLSATVRAAVQRLVALPISTGVESLNVAVAAGIILYELRR